MNWQEVLGTKRTLIDMVRKAKKGASLKTEALTIRMNPKIRYALELMSIKQRRTLTSVLEWALDKAINDPDEGVSQELDQIWEPLEPDRFLKKAFCYPNLLTHEEQVLWKMIQDEDYFCHGKDSPVTFQTVRYEWHEHLKGLLDGSKSLADIPNWDRCIDIERDEQLSQPDMPLQRKSNIRAYLVEEEKYIIGKNDGD